MSNVPTEDDLRNAVAAFILRNAEDSECLHETIYDLYPWPDTAEYDEAEERRGTDQAYELHGRARVYVVIDEVEYHD